MRARSKDYEDGVSAAGDRWTAVLAAWIREDGLAAARIIQRVA